jgi:hypothetical protein
LVFLKNKWVIASMVLALWALISSFFAGYYWLEYTDLNGRIGGVLIYANIGIDYGNVTRIWYNNTKTLTGATLFDVTKQIANVTYQVTIYGTEIISINGVSKQDSYGWTYWIWNGTSNSWAIVWESVDNYLISNEETFIWYYQNGFNPPL